MIGRSSAGLPNASRAPWINSGGNLGSDPPAHRLAADHQPVAAGNSSIASGVDHGPEACFQLGVGIGNAAAVLAIEKVEGDNVDSARRQLGGERHHKSAGLACPSSMSEDQCD